MQFCDLFLFDNFLHNINISFDQFIKRDLKDFAQQYQTVHIGIALVVFPVGNRLSGNIHTVCKFLLGHLCVLTMDFNLLSEFHLVTSLPAYPNPKAGFPLSKGIDIGYFSGVKCILHGVLPGISCKTGTTAQTAVPAMLTFSDTSLRCWGARDSGRLLQFPCTRAEACLPRRTASPDRRADHPCR